MAFDVYVGSLTRYYRGAWENVAQTYARENGLEYRLVRPDDSGEETGEVISDPAAVRAAVVAWRDALNKDLNEHLARPLVWDESDEAPWFTDRPAWVGYGGLVLLAAHEENPEVDLPETVPARWWEDPALELSSRDKYRSTDYMQILAPEIWLPAPFAFTFRFPDLSGHKVWVGSAQGLLEALTALNERTFRGDDDSLAAWRSETPEQRAPFSEAARFGLAVFLELARKAVDHSLPLRLDY